MAQKRELIHVPWWGWLVLLFRGRWLPDLLHCRFDWLGNSTSQLSLISPPPTRPLD